LCNLFVLDKAEFLRILRENPQFAQKITEIARDRFNVDLTT
jgi:CRP-like cAMP-binding protein